MNIDEGFYETAAKGKSKAGKWKDDGYFDFDEKLWKSNGKVIDDSRWYKDDFRVYPVLLDRFAYVKNQPSTRWKKRENFLFFSTNSCKFYLNLMGASVQLAILFASNPITSVLKTNVLLIKKPIYIAR